MSLDELQTQALDIARLYDQKNSNDWHKARTVEQYMSGLVGDVGDLQKLIMAKAGYRHKDDVDAKIKHEMSDILRALLIMAHHLNIDLEQAFIQTMEELRRRFE